MAVAVYDTGQGADGGPPPTGGLWLPFDFATTDAAGTPPGGDPGPIDPNDPFSPPTRTNTVTNAPEGTVVQTDTHYVDPVGHLTWPANIKHVTVTGAVKITTIIRGWQDVHIEGRPDRYIQTGPRHDGGDGMQVKREAGGQVPEDIVIRYWHLHDIDRRDAPGKHSDGVQLMCGRRITFVDCTANRVVPQVFFVRDAGHTAGGGPVEDITFLRCTSTDQWEGFYSFRVSGDDEVGKPGRYVPTRVRIVDCAADKGVGMSNAAVSQGGEVVNWTAL